MKIAKIETFYVPPRWLFVRVEADEGAVGWGGASLEGHAEAVDGAFAALSAHGVVAVGPRRGSEISHRGDRLPGPFFIDGATQCLPGRSEQDRVAHATYAWYRRNAYSAHLAKAIHDAFAFSE